MWWSIAAHKDFIFIVFVHSPADRCRWVVIRYKWETLNAQVITRYHPEKRVSIPYRFFNSHLWHTLRLFTVAANQKMDYKARRRYTTVADVSDFEDNYPHDIQMYDTLPVGEMLLEEFQELGFDRLKGILCASLILQSPNIMMHTIDFICSTTIGRDDQLQRWSEDAGRSQESLMRFFEIRRFEVLCQSLVRRWIQSTVGGTFADQKKGPYIPLHFETCILPWSRAGKMVH